MKIYSQQQQQQQRLPSVMQLKKIVNIFQEKLRKKVLYIVAALHKY